MAATPVTSPIPTATSGKSPTTPVSPSPTTALSCFPTSAPAERSANRPLGLPRVSRVHTGRCRRVPADGGGPRRPRLRGDVVSVVVETGGVVGEHQIEVGYVD